MTNKLRREEFEAWCKTHHHAAMEFGEYTSDYTDFAWKAWQAACAARNKHSGQLNDAQKCAKGEHFWNYRNGTEIPSCFYCDAAYTRHSLPSRSALDLALPEEQNGIPISSKT